MQQRQQRQQWRRSNRIHSSAEPQAEATQALEGTQTSTDHRVPIQASCEPLRSQTPWASLIQTDFSLRSMLYIHTGMQNFGPGPVGAGPVGGYQPSGSSSGPRGGGGAAIGSLPSGGMRIPMRTHPGSSPDGLTRAVKMRIEQLYGTGFIQRQQVCAPSWDHSQV